MKQRLVLIFALATAVFAIGVQHASASDRVESRIVGGEVAPAGAWPSIAAVLQRDMPDPFLAQFCGGTLVAPTVVVTAAHCVYDTTANPHVPRPASFMDVAIGATALSAITAGQRVTLTSIVPYPTYDSDAANYVDDLAILNLSSASAVRPMPVVSAGQDRLLIAGSTTDVAGWGALAWAGAYPDSLRQARVPIVSDSQCATNYGPSLAPSVMLCAGFFDTGGVDSCQGDSGGPLTANLNGTATLIGATSWGVECARAGYPGVYTRLSAFRSWLMSQPGVASYLDGLTATPTVMSVTNAGPDVTMQWTVDPANWSLTGFSTTIAGSTVDVDGGTLARTVAVPGGDLLGVSITSTVTRGSGATATWSGTPTPTRAPIVTTSISGSTKAGDTLTATGSSDDPWAPSVFYQWLRDGAPIAGATAATYGVEQADAGAILAVRATATNGAGTGEATATTSGPVTAAPRTATTTTKTRGIRRVGGVLHANAPTATGYPAPKIAYQWLRNGKAITKATKSAYRLTSTDRGKNLRVRITYRNAEGTTTVTSGQVGVATTIASFAPVPITRTVSITGTPTVGQRLRVAAPLAAGYTTPRVSYRWLRNGKPIPRATRTSYRLTSADRGKRVAVRITYENPAGTTALTTRATRVS